MTSKSDLSRCSDALVISDEANYATNDLTSVSITDGCVLAEY